MQGAISLLAWNMERLAEVLASDVSSDTFVPMVLSKLHVNMLHSGPNIARLSVITLIGRMKDPFDVTIETLYGDILSRWCDVVLGSVKVASGWKDADARSRTWASLQVEHTASPTTTARPLRI